MALLVCVITKLAHLAHLTIRFNDCNATVLKSSRPFYYDLVIDRKFEEGEEDEEDEEEGNIGLLPPNRRDYLLSLFRE